MATQSEINLWDLILDEPELDVELLACAINRELQHTNLDYRTRLLIRRTAEALETAWGHKPYKEWLVRLPTREKLESILREPFEELGFPSLPERVVMVTKPETVEQYLRELGTHVSRPTRLIIGGSIAAILSGLLSRRTEDIDVPDEVPAEIRKLGKQLEELARRYGLRVTHFQSHYLPEGWQNRLHWFNDFGNLNVYLVDPYDLFVGKLFSKREKDRDDLRVLSRSLEKEKIRERVREAESLKSEEDLIRAAENNWYIVYGEKLGGP